MTCCFPVPAEAPPYSMTFEENASLALNDSMWMKRSKAAAPYWNWDVDRVD